MVSCISFKLETCRFKEHFKVLAPVAFIIISVLEIFICGYYNYSINCYSSYVKYTIINFNIYL